MSTSFDLARTRANIWLLQAEHQDSPDTPRRTSGEIAMAKDVLALLDVAEAAQECRDLHMHPGCADVEAALEKLPQVCAEEGQ